MASDVDIIIASEFVGKKAFKEADTATSRLTKQVNTLAKSYLGIVGVQRLLRGAGAAARAFAEDDKAAKVLSQTLTNLGLGFGDNARIVNDYISNLERQTGVLDDELRPAMDRLLRATGDITKSQKLLSLALDVSAGTGKTLTQVSQSLQKGYLGQTQALGRLGVGLSKAELTSSSFEEIQTRLAVLFEGQASMAAETYIGKMNKLTVATNNAKEIIGEGLFDALAATGGGGPGGFDTFTKAVEGASKAVAYLVKLVGTNLGILSLFLTGRPGSATDLILGRTPVQSAGGLTPQIAAELKKAAAEKASAKARAALTKTTKDQTKAIKEQTALQKAGTLFDIEQTGIIAALKGKITDDERKRLELQLAILTGNTAEASKLAGKLAYSQGLTQELVAYLKDLPNAKNPFSAWAGYLDAIEAQVKRIAISGTPSTSGAGGGITSNFGDMGLGDMTDFIPANPGFNKAFPSSVVVNVAGSVISEGELVDVVRNGLINSSLSGAGSLVARRTGTFATL